MISFEVGSNNKFQYRAASILLHHKKVLLQRSMDNQNWFIPGGRVEFFETAELTIEREMMEEFDASITSRKLIWIVENFVQFPTRHVHEIGLFYLVELPGGSPIYLEKEEFVGVEPEYINKWIPIDELDDYKVVPEFVVPELRSLDGNIGIKHIVSKGIRI